MNISDRLRELVLHSLSDFKLIEDNLWRNFRWQQSEVNFLNFCLSHGHLTRQDFQTAVRNRIIRYAEDMHKQTSKYREWVHADHVTSPHALAYGIQEHHFSDLKLRMIHFDHGDTANTFMRGRVTTLVEDIMLQLMADIPVTERTNEPAIMYCAHD